MKPPTSKYQRVSLKDVIGPTWSGVGGLGVWMQLVANGAVVEVQKRVVAGQKRRERRLAEIDRRLTAIEQLKERRKP